MPRTQVVLYETEDGKQPVREFLQGIRDKKLRAKTYRSIGLLERTGRSLTEPEVKHLGGGIWELRTRQSSNAVRYLYYFHAADRVVIVHGFVKKTQKTPARHLRLAQTRMKEWEGRNA